MSGRVDITKELVMKIQKKWGDGIVKIGVAFLKKQDYAAVANEHIDNLYAYDISPVLFKPTKAAKEQFRNNKEAALSYFVATNGVCEEDEGFAIRPWTKVRFENSGIVIQADTALAMGNYYFSDSTGNEIKVEYTFGYIRDDKGNLRINVHHSSIPFTA